MQKKQQQLSLISSPRRSVRETLLKSDFSSSDAAFLSGGLQQRSESFFIETDSYSHILGQWTFTVFAQLFYRHCKYFTSNGCFQSNIICSIIDFRRLCRVKLLIMASDYSAELSIYITLKIFSLHQEQLPRLRLAHCQKHMDACWPILVEWAYGIHIFKLRKKKNEITFSIIGDSEICPCFKSLKNIHTAFK